MLPLPLIVTIGKSRQLRLYLLAIHICAAAAVVLAAIKPLFQMAGVAVLLVSLIYYWRLAPEVRLRGDEEGNVQIWRGAKWHAVQLEASSVVLPGCTVLRIGTPNRWRKMNLLVLPDSLTADEFRHLRVWLRWRASKAFSAQAQTSKTSGKPIQ
jgi:toxin CptA